MNKKILILILLLFMTQYSQSDSNRKMFIKKITKREINKIPSNWDIFIEALIRVESEGKENAVGTKNDVGVLQITPIFVQEVNRILKKKIYTLKNRRNKKKSIEMFNVLQARYNPTKDINKAKYICSSVNRINKRVMSDSDITFMRKLDWVYIHSGGVCDLCGKGCCFNVTNKKFNLSVGMCQRCLKSMKFKNYIDTNVSDILVNMGFDENIIIDSDANIKNIVHDASEFIYSYLLRDSVDSNTEVSAIHINTNVLKKIFESSEKFHPSYTVCMIVVYMFKQSYTYVSKDIIKREIDTWNSQYDTVWNIDVVIRFLQGDHPEVEYDTENSVFVFKRYRKLEEKFINIWKKLDVIQESDIQVDIKSKYKEFIGTESDYADKQCQIFDIIQKNKISILSGIAGSGKSTICSFICREYKDYNILQFAPTGKAVSVIKQKNSELGFTQENVSTIHSFLCNTKVRDRMLASPKKKILIHIDESSMIDLKLFVTVLELVDDLDSNHQVKILISGDHDQLPPIGFGAPFRYLTETLKLNSTNMLRMTKNMRNDCSLAEWLTYNFAKDKCHSIKDFLSFTEKKSEKWQTKRCVSEKIKKFVLSDITKLKRDNYQFVTYNNIICNAINYHIKSNKKITMNYEYHNNMTNVESGDRIMILKNGYDAEGRNLYYNGEEGIIDKIVWGMGKITSFELTKDDGFKNITFTNEHLIRCKPNQLIAYSWCKTIHKTQGDGFNNVCLILDGTSIDKTSLNTALTRTKKDIVVLYSPEWYNKILNRVEINNNSFLPSLFLNVPLDVGNTKDNGELKKKLISLLPKYKYDMKYMIEHDIEISERDLGYLRSKLNKYWTITDYNIFIKALKTL